MDFQIGEEVIHWTYGLGRIVRIEDKTIHGQLESCYVFRTTDLTIWIPINNTEQCSLRKPTPPEEFVRLFDILSSPGVQLIDDRLLRKSQLMDQIKDGQLSSICMVVRDLTHFKRTKKLNDQERSILERTINSLLTEWTYSLEVPLSQAQQTMTALLGD
jgi:RNA polymerase-interacting CarD/CdnL/TRCF family regulator